MNTPLTEERLLQIMANNGTLSPKERTACFIELGGDIAGFHFGKPGPQLAQAVRDHRAYSAARAS